MKTKISQKCAVFYRSKITKFIVGLVSCILLCPIATNPSIAALTQTRHIPDNCADAQYRKNHPNECKFFIAAATPILGGATIIGGALALIGMAGAASGESGGSTMVQPTLPTYNMVGGDVDSIHLAGVMENPEYKLNFNQYNDIRLAYSLARGYTGHGSTIAVLDAGLDTWHGKTVAQIASGPIAPDAVVDSYKITDENMKFLSYREIGDTIAAAGNANIFNASWSVERRATEIHSRAELIRLTDANFVNQLATAAQRDAIFVWAAGNDYDKQQSSALSALPKWIPELNGHFINVVAWDTETGALADYSNVCGITKEWCITAPGTNIDTGKTHASGTSFAAPIVSAAIAVIREAFPYMTAPEITALLFATTRDLGAPGVDDVYGHGMLDLERATRPVGAPLVPIDDGMMQPLQTARVSGTVARRIKSANLQFAYFDEFGRAFSANLADNISVRNPGRGFERLRADTEITGAQIGMMEFGFKHSDLVMGDGFLQTNKNNLMSFIGATQTIAIGPFEIYGRARLGFSLPQTAPNSMITGFSGIYAASAAVGVRIGDWDMTVSVPDSIIAGGMTLRLPAGRANNGAIIYNDYEIDLASRPAMEYSIGYKFISASFIDNPYGTDEFFIMAKGRLKF